MTLKRFVTFLQVTTLIALMTLLMVSGTHLDALPIDYSQMTKDPPAATVEKETVALEPPAPVEEALPDMPPSGDFLYRPNSHKAMLEINEDYMGWVRIPGTAVDYPFVKAADNDFYLKRDILGRADEKGTIFMDYRNIGFDFSNHVILYGHNMKDDSMFGELDGYKDPDFAAKNTLIEIDDFYGTRYFQIYASYFDDANTSYTLTNLEAGQMEAFIDAQRQRSDMAYNLIPPKEAKLLTLVTCSYEVDDGRFFVHAVEVDYEPNSKGS